ncbi:hypothetical protein E2C01_078919 [Portunus trituberculatus]|uniref:Uncharacterized protein n=1 Tax=Portunus trituberculatus TaxID=210409 RepID=A0A5B7IFM8_PORTR|nr:hypothetical protein [Portunus trituberculatus]
MTSKHPSMSSQESDSKKLRRTMTIEKEVEVLDRYAKEEKTSVIDCPCNRTEGEHITYHQS